MKKHLMIFGLMMILSIIPISNVNALTGNNGVEYPDKPDDGHTQFIMGKENNDNEIRLYTFSDEVKYFVVTDWNSNSGGRVGPFFYASGVFGDWDGNTSYKFSTKEYILKNGVWSLNSSYTASTCNTIAYMTPLYSTMDIYFDGTISTSTFPDGYYYITGQHTTGDLVYKSNVIEEYISYEYEIKQSDDNNYSYYDIRVFTNNYNEDYEYLVRFDDEPFQNITSYVSDSVGIYYQIPYNTTMYLWVRDSFGETVEVKTMTFTELIDIEEYDSPTIDINVNCGTDFESNIERSLINLNFNNYSTNYKYQYSFNNVDFIDIPYKDIKNKSYTITTYVNTSIFVRIIDNNDNVIYTNYNTVNCIIDSEQYYYYELTLDDLYNKDENKLIFYTFYYENSNFAQNRDFKPFVYFFYTGSEKLDFHITYNTKAIDLPNYNESLITKTLEDLPCTSLPFEYIDNTVFEDKFTSYTVFSFMPCIDLSTFLYGEQYTDFKLIVKSNIKLNIGEPISFGGNFVPSTNKPIDDSNSFQSNYTNFFEIFSNGFNRFKDVIIEIFQHCTYFFNNVNPIIQDFFITVFVLILFIFLIRFIL